MDVRQLTALVAIADHGTFSAAARRPVHRAVQRLGPRRPAREELGVTLVDRSQGGLTEEGARVVERARRILHELDDIAADMASLDADVSGDARLGVIGTTARWLLPQLLAAVGARPPQRAHHRPRGQHHDAASRASLSGQLTRPSCTCRSTTPSWSIDPLFAEDLVAARPRPTTRSPTARRVALGRARRRPLLLPPRARRCAACSTAPPSTAGVTLRAQAEIDGVRLLASLAFDGYGAAIVPATAVPATVRGRVQADRRARAAPARRRLGARRRPAPELPPSTPSLDAARARSSPTRRGRATRRARRRRRVPARALRVADAVYVLQRRCLPISRSRPTLAGHRRRSRRSGGSAIAGVVWVEFDAGERRRGVLLVDRRRRSSRSRPSPPWQQRLPLVLRAVVERRRHRRGHAPPSTAGVALAAALAECSGIVPDDRRRRRAGGVRPGAAARPRRPRR